MFLEWIFRSRCRHCCSLQFWGGRTADKIHKSYFRHNFDFMADTDTEKYYFRIIPAMNSDRPYLKLGLLGSYNFSSRNGQHLERDRNEIQICIIWGHWGPLCTRIFLVGMSGVLKHHRNEMHACPKTPLYYPYRLGATFPKENCFRIAIAVVNNYHSSELPSP